MKESTKLGNGMRAMGPGQRAASGRLPLLRVLRGQPETSHTQARRSPRI